MLEGLLKWGGANEIAENVVERLPSGEQIFEMFGFNEEDQASSQQPSSTAASTTAVAAAVTSNPHSEQQLHPQQQQLQHSQEKSAEGKIQCEPKINDDDDDDGKNIFDLQVEDKTRAILKEIKEATSSGTLEASCKKLALEICMLQSQLQKSDIVINSKTKEQSSSSSSNSKLKDNSTAKCENKPNIDAENKPNTQKSGTNSGSSDGASIKTSTADGRSKSEVADELAMAKKELEQLWDKYQSVALGALHNALDSKASPKGRASTPNLAEVSIHEGDWVNRVLKVLWATTSEFLQKFAREEILPEIRDKIPPALQPIELERCSLGNRPARIDHIIVMSSRKKRDMIEMQMDINLDADADIVIKANMVGSLGISRLAIQGRLGVVMDPLMPFLPLFGSLSMFFVNPPSIQVELAGLAGSVIDLPIIAETLQNAIEHQVSLAMVLPNRVFAPIITEKEQLPDSQIIELMSPAPLGVLTLHVISARGLKKQLESSPLFGNTNSYCIVRGGPAWNYRTDTVAEDDDPCWEQCFDLLVYDLQQNVIVEVHEERIGADQIIGEYCGSVATMTNAAGGKWLKLSNPQKALDEQHRSNNNTDSSSNKGVTDDDDDGNAEFAIRLEADWKEIEDHVDRQPQYDLLLLDEAIISVWVEAFSGSFKLSRNSDNERQCFLRVCVGSVHQNGSTIVIPESLPFPSTTSSLPASSPQTSPKQSPKPLNVNATTATTTTTSSPPTTTTTSLHSVPPIASSPKLQTVVVSVMQAFHIFCDEANELALSIEIIDGESRDRISEEEEDFNELAELEETETILGWWTIPLRRLLLSPSLSVSGCFALDGTQTNNAKINLCAKIHPLRDEETM